MPRRPILLTGIGIFAATFAAAVIVATVAGHHPLKPLAELAGMMSKAAAYGVELRR